MHFLTSLNEAYSLIRDRILSMNPFASITKVFSLVIQEEKCQKIGSLVNIESSNTFSVKNNVYFKARKIDPRLLTVESSVMSRISVTS